MLNLAHSMTNGRADGRLRDPKTKSVQSRLKKLKLDIDINHCNSWQRDDVALRLLKQSIDCIIHSCSKLEIVDVHFTYRR